MLTMDSMTVAGISIDGATWPPTHTTEAAQVDAVLHDDDPILAALRQRGEDVTYESYAAKLAASGEPTEEDTPRAADPALVEKEAHKVAARRGKRLEAITDYYELANVYAEAARNVPMEVH